MRYPSEPPEPEFITLTQVFWVAFGLGMMAGSCATMCILAFLNQ